jgi:hypothetical protein
MVLTYVNCDRWVYGYGPNNNGLAFFGSAVLAGMEVAAEIAFVMWLVVHLGG